MTPMCVVTTRLASSPMAPARTRSIASSFLSHEADRVHVSHVLMATFFVRFEAQLPKVALCSSGLSSASILSCDARHVHRARRARLFHSRREIRDVAEDVVLHASHDAAEHRAVRHADPNLEILPARRRCREFPCGRRDRTSARGGRAMRLPPRPSSAIRPVTARYPSPTVRILDVVLLSHLIHHLEVVLQKTQRRWA